MCDPSIHYVCVTRDVIWLKRMHFTKETNNEPPVQQDVETTITVAGERDNDNQTTAPSRGVTIGGTTFIPNETEENEPDANETSENDDEWE